MRITGRPFGSPASTYPTLSTPALICFAGPKDVFVPGKGPKDVFVPGEASDRRAARAAALCVFVQPPRPSWAAPIATAVAPAVPRKRRRSELNSPDIVAFLPPRQPMDSVNYSKPRAAPG